MLKQRNFINSYRFLRDQNKTIDFRFYNDFIQVRKN